MNEKCTSDTEQVLMNEEFAIHTQTYILSILTKGQLISKCPFGVIVSTKIPTKKFDNFCPRI